MSQLYVISYGVFYDNILIKYRMTLGPLEYRHYYKQTNNYI